MQIEEKEYDQSFDWRIWKKLFPFMKPFRKYMIIALVFNTLCALVDIALPLFQQYAINHFISGNTTEGIGSFAGTYLVTIIFQTVSVVIFCRCAMVIEMNMAKNMKKACCGSSTRPPITLCNTGATSPAPNWKPICAPICLIISSSFPFPIIIQHQSAIFWQE